MVCTEKRDTGDDGHDGRILADIVAEWATTHREPFTLVLDGSAGGTDAQGAGGEHVEDVFGANCLTPASAPTIRSLGDLEPNTLAVMHGSSVTGDCSGALQGLADDDERRLLTSTARWACVGCAERREPSIG